MKQIYLIPVQRVKCAHIIARVIYPVLQSSRLSLYFARIGRGEAREDAHAQISMTKAR